MGINSYKELKVWQIAMELVKKVYKTTENYPKKEQYRLTDQLCRAAVSIPSNIAEGSSRKSTKEFIRYINVAKGSLAELETQLIISYDIGYIQKNAIDDILSYTNTLGRMLSALQNSLETKITNDNKEAKFQTLDSEL